MKNLLFALSLGLAVAACGDLEDALSINYATCSPVCAINQVCEGGSCTNTGGVGANGVCTSNSQCISGVCQDGRCLPPTFRVLVPSGVTVQFYDAVNSTPTSSHTSSGPAVNSTPSLRETGAAAPGAASCQCLGYCGATVACRPNQAGVPICGWNFGCGG